MDCLSLLLPSVFMPENKELIYFIIPMAVGAAGGFEAIDAGLGGLAGNRNIFDPGVAFSFGIVTSIGLIAGAISDQQYWQRYRQAGGRQEDGGEQAGGIT